MAMYAEDLQVSLDRNKASLRALKAINSRVSFDLSKEICHLQDCIAEQQAQMNTGSLLVFTGDKTLSASISEVLGRKMTATINRNFAGADKRVADVMRRPLQIIFPTVFEGKHDET